jgi:hypothetical protein
MNETWSGTVLYKAIPLGDGNLYTFLIAATLNAHNAL